MKINFNDMNKASLESMLAAGDEINECYRVLKKIDSNIIADILRNEGVFYQWDHYPKGDVYDKDSHSQFYYHAHRPEDGEHGHLHTFMRRKGIPSDIKPFDYQGQANWPTGDDIMSHIIAITMDNSGKPYSLFTTNRWVTGENWYLAKDVIAMGKIFEIDHPWPSWPGNVWLTAMMRLFKPQIEYLLIERDKKMLQWQNKYPDIDIYEDRKLEITSKINIDVEKQLQMINNALMKK